MVSVVCSNALNRSVKEFGLTSPAEILDKTRSLVIETFARSGEDIKDGMDIALCAIQEDKLIFAGANNPLWIVRSTKALTKEQFDARGTVIIDSLAWIEYKGTKQPVGLYAGMKPFEEQELLLTKGDSIYIFTDGFADQFGGEKGKKLKYKPFKEQLIQINKLEMNIQKETVESTFIEWKGGYEQVDDVCVIGIRI
jgi:serine phosphatase RsbU (regulator of sigma subunit)